MSVVGWAKIRADRRGEHLGVSLVDRSLHVPDEVDLCAGSATRSVLRAGGRRYGAGGALDGAIDGGERDSEQLGEFEAGVVAGAPEGDEVASCLAAELEPSWVCGRR